MKQLARRAYDIEYLSERRPARKPAPEPERKGWLRRHPLAAGIMVAGITVACWMFSCGGEEKGERQATKMQDSAREMRKQKMRNDLQQIRVMMKLQKSMRERRQEFEQKEKEEDDRMLREFGDMLDEADEEELDNMLNEQNQAIAELEEDEDTDREIELARIKRSMVKEKQYLLEMEEEIREEGLLDKTQAELEMLRLEQESIIATEQFYATDQYMNALVVVELIDRAMQIKWMTEDREA